MARTKRKTSSRNRGRTPPPDNGERTQLVEENYEHILEEAKLRQKHLDNLLGKKIRDLQEQARRARAEQEAKVDECRRYLRRFETPPDALFQVWVEDCIADGTDPVEMLHNLSRPLKVRLEELIGERPKGWDDDFEPPKDRDLSRFHRWDVFDDREPNPLAAELVTFLEDKKEEWRNWQGCRSTWRLAEWKRAEPVVDALRESIRQVKKYIRDLPGDEPEADPRIDAVWPVLREAERLLRGIRVDRPKAARGRPMAGPEKDWASKVESEVFQRLEKLRPWKKDDYDSKTEHIRMLGRLSEKIVKRLGIRPKRGIDSAYR